MTLNKSVYNGCDYIQVYELLNIMNTESNSFNKVSVIRGLIDAPLHGSLYSHLNELRPNDYPIFGKN